MSKGRQGWQRVVLAGSVPTWGSQRQAGGWAVRVGRSAAFFALTLISNDFPLPLLARRLQRTAYNTSLKFLLVLEVREVQDVISYSEQV